MKMIPRNVHAVIDYIVGLALIAAPWVFGFADNGPATYVPVALGLGALAYSMLTNYELGVMKVIPFRIHKMLDIASGLFLAASPWLFNFADYVYLPHVIVGVFEVIAGLTTKDSPAYVDRTHPSIRHA